MFACHDCKRGKREKIWEGEKSFVTAGKKEREGERDDIGERREERKGE